MSKIASKKAKFIPKCPHCEERLPEIHWKAVSSFNYEYVYLCPKCEKILGFGSR